MILELNESACTSCGMCAADCPLMIISMENGKPFITKQNEAQCFNCHHCMAVCPEAALTINGAKPEDSVSLKNFTPDLPNLEMVMKSRRSCRSYQEKDVDKELLDRVLNITAYAPTGRNAASVTFTVIDNAADMTGFQGKMKAALQKVRDNLTLPDEAAFIYDYIGMWLDGGVNTFFRNAPHLLVTSAPKDVVSPDTDGIIAATFFDLAASAHGLGVCWNGLVKFTLQVIAPELKKELGIPENHVIGYAMTFGYPAVKYSRTVQRKAIINRAEF